MSILHQFTIVYHARIPFFYESSASRLKKNVRLHFELPEHVN